MGVSRYCLERGSSKVCLAKMASGTTQTRGVSHYGLAIYMKISIFRQKKNYKNYSNISACKNIIFQKKSSKRNQNPSRYYYNSITNLKFSTQAKISSFKNPCMKIDLLLLPRGQAKNPLSYYYTLE
jgi:hypothetical protein